VTGLEGDAQVLTGIGLVALEQFDVHVGHPPRRLDESFARGVLADRLEELAHEALHPSWSTTSRPRR
jgi:hypothetical protein